MATDPTDQRGTETMEKYVEIRITPADGGRIPPEEAKRGLAFFRRR